MEFHDEKFELPSGKWWRIMLQLSENLRNLVFEREPGASGRGGGTAAPAGATRPPELHLWTNHDSTGRGVNFQPACLPKDVFFGPKMQV